MLFRSCGVVIDVNDTNADHTFVNGSLKARGDVFEDFFYGMQSLNITKANLLGDERIKITLLRYGFIP